MKEGKFVIITSINPPTTAVLEFAKWPGWTTVVIGDRKSPKGWSSDGVVFLSVDQQLAEFPEFSQFVPENSYVRKMIGYLYAIRHGAVTIFESDDDNIPYAGAVETVEADLAGERLVGAEIGSESGWLNVYREFGASDCWPRGYPLQYLREEKVRRSSTEGAGQRWAVRQYLADEDPDVDAVYRMTRERSVYFARERSLRLKAGTYCPFNSQATLWSREAFPLLFLPLGVTDRVTDILRGYIALSCLWRCGQTLAFASPVVYQQRNVHNLLRDFEQEIDLYRFGHQWSQRLLSLNGAVGATDPGQAFASALDLLIADGVLPATNRNAYSSFLTTARRGAE